MNKSFVLFSEERITRDLKGRVLGGPEKSDGRGE
jgi:hypothetical protein